MKVPLGPSRSLGRSTSLPDIGSSRLSRVLHELRHPALRQARRSRDSVVGPSFPPQTAHSREPDLRQTLEFRIEGSEGIAHRANLLDRPANLTQALCLRP